MEATKKPGKTSWSVGAQQLRRIPKTPLRQNQKALPFIECWEAHNIIRQKEHFLEKKRTCNMKKSDWTRSSSNPSSTSVFTSVFSATGPYVCANRGKHTEFTNLMKWTKLNFWKTPKLKAPLFHSQAHSLRVLRPARNPQALRLLLWARLRQHTAARPGPAAKTKPPKAPHPGRKASFPRTSLRT